MAALEQKLDTESVPTPEELYQEIPLTDDQAAFVHRSRETIEAILNGWDQRLLVVVGPCSIHDPVAALEYGAQLRQLADEVSDHIFLVMRTYFEKARTIVGWKGMLYDPELNGSYQLAKGIRQTRLLLRELSEMGLPSGSELLELNTFHYYADYLSWGCIGARTSSSPPHRQMASLLNFPIGFKNSTEGNIDHAIHGILAAATPQAFLGVSPSGQMSRLLTEGNPLCHLVLRGGEMGPNYHPENVAAAIQKCERALINPRVIIDCSHDNCGKKPEQQKRVFHSCIEQIQAGNQNIVGIMLESHLHGGSQELAFPLKHGISITDPCLDWAATQALIREGSNLLNRLR